MNGREAVPFIDNIKICIRKIGPSHPCFIIGEVAQAHDGSLGLAHAFIDAIADAGADAVKFQTHIAAAESSPEEPWRVKFSLQDATRYEYWQRMEFTEEQWAGLKKHADEKELVFLSSPFSVEAVELLTRIGVSAWKVASGEVGNPILFEAIRKTGLPVIFSSGMSGWAELDEAVARARDACVDYAVMQCSTAYPCPPEKVGLNLMAQMKERYQCPVGLSDHTGVVHTAIAAAAIDCDLYETHVTLSREMFGPDVSSSVTTAELRQLVDGIRYVEKMTANPVDKDEMATELEPLRRIFSKSVAVRQDMLAGAIVSREMLSVKKPGTGIPASEIDSLVGKKLSRGISAGAILRWDDIVR